MESIEQSGRTVEEAVQAALKALGRSRDDVDVEVIEQESRGLLGILGYSSARVRVTVRVESATEAVAEPPAQELEAPPAEPRRPRRPVEDQSPLAGRALDIVGRILELMGIDAEAEVTADDEEAVSIEIHSSEDIGLLIGKRGQTLTALQLLVAMMANRDEHPDQRRRVVLDAEGYRARRERTLRSMARNAAQRAKRTGRPVTLDSLNPRERRIVHLALADDPAVATRSEGEDPNRSVVITARRRGSGQNRR
jgi:spoIIIJ-associated protein